MRFSKEESGQVVKAAEEAARALGLRDAGDLLAGQGTKHPVWKELAEQFPQRTALSLYSHVKRQCHPGAHKGKWSDDETAQLKALYALHGPNWGDVAAEIGRTPEACRDRFRAVCGEATEDISHDKWTDDETSLLVDSKVNGVPILDIEDPADISFVRVARRIKTRNKQQCARMWHKLRGFTHADGVLRDPAHQLELCEKVQKYASYEDVPWSKLGYDRLGCSTTFAQSCFDKLARPYCADNMAFVDLLALLIANLQQNVEAETLAEWMTEDHRKRKRQAELNPLPLPLRKS